MYADIRGVSFLCPQIEDDEDEFMGTIEEVCFAESVYDIISIVQKCSTISMCNMNISKDVKSNIIYSMPHNFSVIARK